MGRRPNNYRDKADQPPPSYEDLQFQAPVWYARYGYRAGPQLSPEFHNSVFNDKSLTWLIGDQISGAAAILLREDSD